MPLPSYFSDYLKLDDDFEQSVPLKQQYSVDYIYRPPNQGFMRPKLYNFIRTETIYFLSPRKVLVHSLQQGRGFTYADRFATESVIVMTQTQPETENENIETTDFKVRLEEHYRINWF